jgi:hypothetical protein
MASSRGSAEGHLDATGDREVVFCHQCEHEWYRDESGLICPRCEGEATEIVSCLVVPNWSFLLTMSSQILPDNDPRDIHDAFPGFGHHHNDHHHTHAHETDSDPEEADIDEHTMGGPGGIYGRRIIFRSPEQPGDGTQPRTNPGAADDIISRFTEMLGDMGGPRVVGRSGPAQLFSGGEGNGAPRVSYTRFSGPGFGGGMTTVSISSISNGSTRTTIRSGNAADDDPFQSYALLSPHPLPLANQNGSVFGSLFGQMGPPPIGGERDRSTEDSEREQGAQVPPNVNLILQQIFSQMLGPGGGVYGDAVGTQEALDRIISRLMEENPQSNAPPPASEDTIANLPRRKLDEQMLGPELKGECTICIDEMNLGDEAIVLPCRHWFHEECVVLWLREHNTCPICRAPVDGNAAGQPVSTPSGSEEQPSPFSFPSASASASGPTPPGPSELRRSNLRQRGSERLSSIRDEANSSGSSWRASRRNSDSPPQSNPSNPSRRDRSPSELRSDRSDRSRSGGGSSGGLFGRLRDSFGRDRRHP